MALADLKEKHENEVEQPVSHGLDHLRADIIGCVADFPATVHFAICKKWFREADTEDAHPCGCQMSN